MPHPVVLTIKGHTKPAKLTAGHVGKFTYCAYWRRWDRIDDVGQDGQLVKVHQVDLSGRRTGSDRWHSTPIHADSIFDAPFDPYAA